MGDTGLERRMEADAKALCAQLELQLSPAHRVSDVGDGWEVRDKR